MFVQFYERLDERLFLWRWNIRKKFRFDTRLATPTFGDLEVAAKLRTSLESSDVRDTLIPL